MANKIYTKTGDKGNTSLLGGKKVPKSDLQIEAYGNVDELNAFVGLLRDKLSAQEKVKDQLFKIQHDLFILGSLLACATEFKEMNLPEITEREIKLLEQWIDEYDKDLPKLTAFILPGGNEVVSTCNVCRTVCRRAERSIIKWSEIQETEKNIIPYINRLSDYFFILARTIAKALDSPETLWISDQKNQYFK